MVVLKKIYNWYERNERLVGTISLVFGFVVGSFTLTQVDRIFENVLIALQLLAVAVCIILLNHEERKRTLSVSEQTESSKLHFWMTATLQFFFGGILSTYLVFYFKGSVFAVAWPFLLILFVAIILSETGRRHYSRIGFQIGFFFLSLFVFSLFFVPVILRQIGPGIFVLSWIMSLLALSVFLTVLWFVDKQRFVKGKKIFAGIIFGISLSIGILYFGDIIPPLPILLRDSGVYHSISRNTSGDYVVARETEQPRNGILRIVSDARSTIHIVPGAPAYVYSAIFSPISFNTKITHEWQMYDKTTHAWITKETINLSVVGGRENGYRTYSMRTSLSDGKWRVNVKTKNGQTIGRIRFKVITQDTIPTLFTETK